MIEWRGVSECVVRGCACVKEVCDRVEGWGVSECVVRGCACVKESV